MPYELSLIDSRGEEIEFVYPLVRVREIDGLGMPAVRHLEEQYAQQDGVTYLGTRLGKRVISIGFDFWAATEGQMWAARQELLALVKTFSAGFAVRVTTPGGLTAQVDARYDNALTLVRPWDENKRMQAAVMQCVAHNPVWYDPTSVLWAYAVAGGFGSWGWEPDGLGFPAAFGGSAGVGIPETKQYLGTWDAYPVITLHGPMTKPIITNHTLDLKLEFVDGYEIEEGDSVVIDLSQDSQARRVLTVTHSVDGNVPDALTSDSDLGTWRIAAHPDAVDGNNSISMAFTDGNAHSRTELRFYTRYIGL
jgi:hypothetical protein